ncbi:outer membrane beta-barrel protein [Olivibacter sitiensis]|uniref:outer membrane beta-barrel protein n=1 Tax=Olivibacter sitiensis TaxID=376470 RepID=UPI000405FE34|nr:outer membrane beta-barrel protein [Olivibacter sitiensis]
MTPRNFTLSVFSFFLIAICSHTALFAQNKGLISGVLADSTDHSQPLGYATVSLFKDQDTTMYMYRLSDDKGAFSFKNLPVDATYRLVINAWQREVLRKQVEITKDKPDIKLDSIFLALRLKDLDEVVISAERPPILVRNDTIEFNAESFKTLPSAVVEDLLRKLPGVDVAEDGSIRVNGKPVSRILVDGKEFFGGNQQIATKNLPSNLIDKVQVTEDKEITNQNPDLVASEIPQVINLKLKKEVKQGAFGKLYGGGGLDELYEVGAILNAFRDTTQLSILGYGNNVNKPAFGMNDMMSLGGFSRSGSNSIYMNSDGGYRINDIGFGGSMGGGIQSSAGGGFNFNTLTKKGLVVNGQYFLGYSDNFLKRQTYTDQTLPSYNLISNSLAQNTNRSYTHNIGGKLRWKIDSMSTFNLTPNVTISTLNNRGMDSLMTENSIGQLTNASQNEQYQQGTNLSYNIQTDYSRSSVRKKGRTFNSALRISGTDNSDDNQNFSNSVFYLEPSQTVVDQLRQNKVSNFNAFLSANYVEPLSKKFSLTFYFTGTYLEQENALSTFYKDEASDDYIVAVPSLSETVQQDGFKGYARARIRWSVNSKLRIEPGLIFNTINLSNKFTSHESFKQDFHYVLPSLTVRYKDWQLDYSPSIQEVNAQYLQPVANNTNPLFIQYGNPDLKPTENHRVSLNLYKYDMKSGLSYNVYSYGTIQNNGIVMARTIDADGVQTATPVNVNGFWQEYAGVYVNKSFKFSKNQLTLSGGMYGSYDRRKMILNEVESNADVYNFNPRISVRVNFNDVLELGQNYNFSRGISRYEDSFFNDLSFVTHSGESMLIVRLPKKLVWETNFQFISNRQQLEGYNNEIKLWNAGLTYLFMKNDRAQLKFSVNDLLQNAVRRNLTITENRINDIQTNNIGRYFMLTLTYNIQNFGQKVGGKDRFFMF